MKGYYVLCVDVEEERDFRDIGMGIERAVSTIGGLMKSKMYLFHTESDKAKLIIDAFEKGDG
jgi:hypothetical protein